MNGQRNINLLIVTYNLDYGGVEDVIHSYARLLNKATYNISVICLVSGAVSTEIAKIAGVKMIHVTTRSRIRRFFTILNIAREMRIDLVHNHACWYGLVIGFLVGAKCIETVHNVYDWFNWHERLRYGLYCFLANRIIAVSENVRTFTLSSFPFMKEKKFIVVHNGIDCDRFNTKVSTSELRNDLRISTEDVVIGFIGRLTEQKGMVYLLEAAEQLSKKFRNLSYVIVGDGELSEDLKARAQQLKLPNVHFVGFQRETSRYLQLFDIFVLPSLWEGLPISVLEAMAAARPVVATAVSGTREVIIHGITGYLVEPRSVSGLIDRLSYLIEHHNVRTNMGQKGNERVLEHFSAQLMVAKTESIYNELL